jgi:hypothetical protein
MPIFPSSLAAMCCLLAVSSVVATETNIKEDFMRAMDEATTGLRARAHQRSLLEGLLSKATLVRQLGDVANYDGNDFPIHEYALKYVGCQNIKSFNDDLAEDEEATDVLGLDRFVVFRLCSADLCSTYNKYGCEYNFGEYAIEMEDYLQTMSAYHYSRYQEYCETCYECMHEQVEEGVYNITDEEEVYNATNVTDYNAWSAVKDCEYYSVCFNYVQACRDYGKNDPSQYEEFFSCAQYNDGNNDAYLGPHCASDGHSIQIGMFEGTFTALCARKVRRVSASCTCFNSRHSSTSHPQQTRTV